MRNERRRMLVISFIGLFLIPGAIGALRTARPLEAQPESTTPIVQDYLDPARTILYIGNIDDRGSPFAVVMYEPHHPEDLRYYARISRQRGEMLLQAGVQELYVWVTFRHPLDPSVFAEWVKQNRFCVRQYNLRLMGRTGDRITGSAFSLGKAGCASPEDLLGAHPFAHGMRHVQERENGQAKLLGIYDVKGTIQAEAYRRILQDPRVFLVDVTGSLVYRHPSFQAQVRMSWEDFASRFQINGPSFFWHMEDFGLEPFATDPTER